MTSPSNANTKELAKLEAIDEIVSGDWGFSVTDDMVNLHTGEYKKFTQQQAEDMANAIGKIYMIAHTIHCGACDRKWSNKYPDEYPKYLQKISFYAGIPVEVLQGYLNAKDEL